MRCHICDADSDTVVLEGCGFSPCAECQAVIYETLQGYHDIPTSEIDELVEPEFDGPEPDDFDYPVQEDED